MRKGVNANAIGSMTAILAAFCWGSATVMSKSALGVFTPISLLVLQLIASVTLLWVVVYLRKVPHLPMRHVLRFAWLGLLEPGFAYLFGLIGLEYIQASSAALIQASESIMIIVATAILFKERPGNRLIILSIVALSGIFLTLNVGFSNGMHSVLGKFYIFCGTTSAAIYVALSSRFVAEADPIYIVAWQQTVALCFSILILAIEWGMHVNVPLFSVSLNLWLFAALSGMVQYAMAFSLYMIALNNINVNVAGSFLSLIPLFGLAGAYIFLREELSFIQLIGAFITITAIILINFNKMRRTHTAIDLEKI